MSAQDALHYLRPGSLMLPALPPLSIYVHLPWCLKKCPYCDFNSHEVRTANTLEDALQNRYIDALILDAESALPLVWGRPIHSIFMGGGTPSLFAPAQIERLSPPCARVFRSRQIVKSHWKPIPALFKKTVLPPTAPRA